MAVIQRMEKSATKFYTNIYSMKKTLSAFIILCTLSAHAQKENCMDRILAKDGGWIQLKETVKASASDYAVQKRFSTALFNSLSGYQPRGLQAQWSGSYASVVYKQPVARFQNTLYAMKYSCNGEELKLDNTTNTKFYADFNSVSFAEIYDSTTDYHGTGFFSLREELPTEIKPGIWQFKDVRTPLGFGIEGITKLWLITHPGELPWSYVTRREFLQKRKRNVQRLYAEAKKQTQEAIDFWETFKKQKEKEFAGDAAKLANFMSGYYNPGVAEAKAKQPKILGQYETSLQRIDEQLSAPSAELDKKAIVIKNSNNHLDYDFTDQMEQFAELLIKPNPSYFKRGLAPAVPQMISIGI